MVDFQCRVKNLNFYFVDNLEILKVFEKGRDMIRVVFLDGN